MTVTTKQTNTSFFVLLLILCIAAVTVMTLMFSPKQVTKGYALNALEDHYQDLSRQREEKDMQLSIARSLQLVEASDKVQGMVRPTAIGFVDGDTAIASR